MSKNFSVMRIIGDHAVLQSGCENRIYGYSPACAGIKLAVTGGERSYETSAKADDSGRWELTLPPFEPSLKAYSFEFSCGGDTLSFSDIYFGELFHISGQSNMELPMCRTTDPLEPKELPVCDMIREFRVPIQCCFGRDEEYEDFLGGEWKTATADNVPEMSAAGFYFAYELHKKYGFPVGLLNTSAGGAPVEAYMPYKMLSDFGGYDEFLAKCTAEGYMKTTEQADMKRNEERYAELDRLDRFSGELPGNGASFTPRTVPFDFKDDPELAGFCGRIWFRKTFDIPAGADLSDAVLILGTLTDADITYLNGTKVGETGYMYPLRIYPVPAGTAVHGTNTVLVCLDVRYGGGGFTKDKKYCLKLKDRLIDLSGEWEYAVAAKVPVMQRETFFQGLPLSMYGALAAPSFNVKYRALVWYQGESNCYKPERYHFLFGELVKLFRTRCGHDFPVIFTQLCNFDDPFAGGSDCWAELRAAQLECLDIPGTDMAVTIDVGESNDLHPLNKAEVGRRLALCAMRTLYGDKTVQPAVFCTGAQYRDGKVLLRFDGEVKLADNAAGAFDICFANGMTAASSAELTAEGVILGFDADERPAKVRCEWRNDPKIIALRQSDGIPLSPFAVNVT